jgi:hypothetical protein
MGDIVAFKRIERQAGPTSLRESGPAQILFFTGVRYEREACQPAKTTSPRKPRRDASGKSRRKQPA